jgi:hypothetical protein
MSDTMEGQLRSAFRNLFPDFAEQFDRASDEDAIEQLYERLMANALLELNGALAAANLSGDDVQRGAAICLSPTRYQALIEARDDRLKEELLALIKGLQDLKARQQESPRVFAGAMVSMGVPAVSPATPTFFEALNGGAPEAEAAAAGLAVTSPAVVIATVVVVILAIIVLLYFMTKPSNCVTLLINELDEPLTFDGDFNVSGKPATVTMSIPPGAVVPGRGRYPLAGFFVSKRKPGFYGTQYGFTMKHAIGHLTFGVCCTLTNSGGPNSCYCHIGATAQNAAVRTDEQRRQSYQDAHGDLNLSILCNSKSGSPAYYIARAYRG